MITYWNPAISNQLRNFVNYYVDINKMVGTTNRPLTAREFNPFELIVENRDKFMRADTAYFAVIKKFKKNLIDD